MSVELNGVDLNDVDAYLQELMQAAAKEIAIRFQKAEELLDTYDATMNDDLLPQLATLLEEIEAISEVTSYEYSNEDILRRIRRLDADDVEYAKVDDLIDAAGEMLCKIDNWNRSFC